MSFFLFKASKRDSKDSTLTNSSFFFEQPVIEKEDAIKAKEGEFGKEIEELESKKANLEKQINDAKFDDADGGKLQRVSDDKLQKMFTNGSLNSDAKPTKRALRAAILGYKTATDDTKKEEYKTMAKQIWENLSPDDKEDSTLKAAMDIIDS